MIGAGGSLIAAFVVLVQPAFQANREVAAALDRLTAPDQVSKLAVADISGIELNLLDNFRGDAPCDSICRGILAGDQADWVRVVFADDGQGNKVTRRYGMATGAVCGTAETCLQLINPSDATADLIVTQTRVDLDAYEFNLTPRLARVTKAQTLAIRDTRTDAIVFHQTFADYELATALVYWVPKFQQMNSDGYEVYRTERQAQVTSIDAALTRIGLPVTPRAAPQRDANKSYTKLPTTLETSAVLAILAKPADMPFEPQDQAALRDYVDKVRWFPEGGLPDVHRDTVFALFQHTRFHDGWALDQVLRKDVELKARLLPWMLDALEAGTPIAPRTLQSFQSGLRGGYDVNALAPYSAQYARILASLPADASDSWFFPVGRFGVDPATFLDATAHSGDQAVTRTIAAYCFSAPGWEDALAKRLWHELLVFCSTQQNARLSRSPYDPAIEILEFAGFGAELDRWFGLMNMSEDARQKLDQRRARITAKTRKQIVC